MKLFDQMRGGLRRLYHQREIEVSLRHYREQTGQDAGARAAYADSGTFRSQVDRLFAIGSPAETPTLQEIAESAVRACLTNKYYTPADCLGDVVDALEGWTFVTSLGDGEPPLEGLADHERRAKLAAVREAWLLPLKIAALEGLLAHYAQRLGRSLPYTSLARFERWAARLVALSEQSEVTWVIERARAFVDDWQDGGRSRPRFHEPAAGLEAVVACLEGDTWLEALAPLRLRARRLMWRLSTVVPEDRARYLEVAFASLTTPAEGPSVGQAATPLLGAMVGARTDTGPPPAPAGAQAPADEQEGPAPLTIVLHCPECGAPFTVDDETISVECDHCSSLLVISAPGRDEVYVQGNLLRSDEQVLKTIIGYRVEEQRAEIATRYRDQNGDPPAEAFITARLRDFEALLLVRTQLLEVHWIHGPYWHISGKIVQAVLGRAQQGAKQLRVRAFAVEHTVPGYDGAAADLRDRGLRLARSRVEPLTVRRVQESGAFLPWQTIPERSYREVEKWCTRQLQPDLDPINKHGEFLLGRRVLVYRPYCLALVEVERDLEWVLVDCGFGTIAGYPTAPEAQELLRACVRDPLRSAEESFRKVVAVPPRCPDCGFEQRLDRRFCQVLCPNCYRGLAPLATGMRVVPYDHAQGDLPSSSTEYLPFWRYSFQIDVPEGPPVTDLEHYAASLFSRRDQPPFALKGDGLWIPAARLLGTQNGDEAFAALAQWIHRHPPVVSPGRVPLHERPRFWGVSLPEAEARLLGRFVLMALHDLLSAARLDAFLMKRRLIDARVELSSPRLVLVPLGQVEQGLALPGTQTVIPRLLLTGGPRLEALRESVHRSATTR